MEINKEIYNRLVDFIIREYWGKKSELTPATTLEGGLGITGDDGLEFIDKFLIEFNISYEERDGRPRYFYDEGGGLIDFVAIVNWWRGKKNNVPKCDLTLQHLVKVIELGYWVDMEVEKSN